MVMSVMADTNLCGSELGISPSFLAISSRALRRSCSSLFCFSRSPSLSLDDVSSASAAAPPATSMPRQAPATVRLFMVRFCFFRYGCFMSVGDDDLFFCVCDETRPLLGVPNASSRLYGHEFLFFTSSETVQAVAVPPAPARRPYWFEFFFELV